ncbi:hypothetical protein SAMN05444280_12671 [Tangfeifania diversioriginum]|uniref:DUF6787 domain-containing protein n=1 Tax=Tangfeifania diversioriginum TaxID=1168035 RepID=A0A1M6LEN0_9BACT|nr:DUF6787 family protein [Tangfeifania diversioriginum]SHJ69627.1 hypothetical protein SAMN05444280_12671 [Tangfeifania diversioriginum]
MIEKLKRKWNIKNNFQLVLILIIFSVTGSASLYVRKFVFSWMEISTDTSLWIKVPLYILIVFPSYQILLLIISGLLGQFRFAWEFEKKVFSRFKFRK